MSTKNGFSRFVAGYGRLTLLMIPIGIAINFIGGQIAVLLKLPIYLDSIGTILVGALCGGIPGALVGGISNILNSITSPTNIPYAILSIIFGLLAGWFSRMGVFRSLWKTLLSSLAFAAVGGGLGAIITLILFGGLSAGGMGVIVGIVHAAGMDLNLANFLVAIPADVVDKVPTVLIVYVILKRMPKRLFAKLPLGSVYLQKTPKRGVVSEPSSIS